MPTHLQSLAGSSWIVRPVGDLSHVPEHIHTRIIPATVPGCVHTDLIDAGLICDPRIGDAENEVQWVSWTDWRYELTFRADDELLANEAIDLVFEHLDTIADVELNGVKIGSASSEFLPWRFAARHALRRGENMLAVTFASPLRYVAAESARLGPRPVNGDYPAYNMIRKCASNFEWDWGPRVATCGIAGGVRLESVGVGRLVTINTETRVASKEKNRWHVRIDAEIEWRRGSCEQFALIRALVRLPDRDVVAEKSTRIADPRANITMVVDDPRPWSPVGHGEQQVYPFEVELLTAATPLSGCDPASRRVHDRHVSTIGFRVAERASWHHFNDFFPLHINEHPIYCRGANWIPEGIFPSDRTPERVRERLMQLKAANMNMIRVWGGGRYEPDWFYDMCDELGIMVWQDFMMSCACYPEEEPIRSLIDQEAKYHAARLSRHPCVVLWCGGNECIWAHESWGFKEKLAPDQTWGLLYYDKILFDAVGGALSAIPYIRNSPFSPTAGIHPNEPTHGDTHTWEVWGDGYRTVTPRFCSEFGQQGPSNLETLSNAGLTPREGDAEMMPPLLLARQRGPGGNKRWYDDPIAAWFRPARSFEEWHYLAQLLQARSLRIGVEWQRANMPTCMGSLIWQLNDAWPGLSWSLIDAAGREKPSYFAVQRAFQDRLLTIQPFDGALQLVAVNDSEDAWNASLRVRRMTIDGATLAEHHTMIDAPPRAAVKVAAAAAMVGEPADPAREFIVADTAGGRAEWFYRPDREIHYTPPAHEITAGRFHAATLVRDGVLVFDDHTTHVLPPLLLPGESCELPDSLPATRHRLVCANSFGATA